MANRFRSIDTISERRREKISRVLSQRQPDLTIVIENVHDPHNVSAVFRTADAVGIEAIHLVYTVEEFPVIAKTSSSSAKKWVQSKQYRSIEECFHVLHEDGFTIYASHLEAESISLYEIDLTKKIALVLGNEHRGVSDEACALADAVYSIPMMGMIQSLNISVAAAVSMYEALRQRLSAGIYDHARYDAALLAQKIEDWSKK